MGCVESAQKDATTHNINAGLCFQERARCRTLWCFQLSLSLYHLISSHTLSLERAFAFLLTRLRRPTLYGYHIVDASARTCSQRHHRNRQKCFDIARATGTNAPRFGWIRKLHLYLLWSGKRRSTAISKWHCRRKVGSLSKYLLHLKLNKSASKYLLNYYFELYKIAICIRIWPWFSSTHIVLADNKLVKL